MAFTRHGCSRSSSGETSSARCHCPKQDGIRPASRSMAECQRDPTAVCIVHGPGGCFALKEQRPATAGCGSVWGRPWPILRPTLLLPAIRANAEVRVPRCDLKPGRAVVGVVVGPARSLVGLHIVDVGPALGRALLRFLQKQRTCTACRGPPYPSAEISSKRRFSGSLPPSRHERRCGRTRAQRRAMARARTLGVALGDLPRACITP
jgi:hypothetical protein